MQDLDEKSEFKLSGKIALGARAPNKVHSVPAQETDKYRAKFG